MSRSPVLAALLLGAVVFAATPARAEVKNFNGQVAPDLGNFEQANGADRINSLAGLKGQAVMLEFFATW